LRCNALVGREIGGGENEREIYMSMDKLQLAGQNLGRVFNSRSGCMCARHLFCYEAKQPNLKLKTRPKQLLGSLPIGFALPGMRRKKYLKNLVGGRGK
jgi:hypothetical protein